MSALWLKQAPVSSARKLLMAYDMARVALHASGFSCHGFALLIKNTFLHVAELEGNGGRRNSSAPPRMRHEATCSMANPRTRRAARVRKSNKVGSSDEDMLRQYATRAREERWALWARKILARRRDNAWRWHRLALRLARGTPMPQQRAFMSSRMFIHVMQYAMSPFDVVVFHATRVLRRHGQMVQIWASDPMMQAKRVKRLLRSVERLSSMALQGQILLHLPDNSMFAVRWEYNFPLSALQGKALLQCGLPPEQQRLQCLGQDLCGNALGECGVRPGDVVDVVQI